MTKLKTTLLYSGSDGNCAHITDGTTEIIIDAGRNESRLVSALANIGTSIDNISAILITHEHTDHINALYTLEKRHHIPIFTGGETARAICSHPKTPIETLRQIAGCVQIVEDGAEYEIGSFLVTPFNTPHDVASFGFKLVEQTGNKSLAYATDTGCVTRKMLEYFEGSELAVIEANHDKDMLINGVYPEFLKQRILSDRGHLSNDIAARFALWLAENGTREAILAHLSKDNNTETCVKNVVRETLARNDVKNFNFRIAKVFEPVEIVI